MLRLLVLPGQLADALALLEAAAALGPQNLVLSLMSQYVPPAEETLLAALPKPLRRRLSSFEYKKAAARAAELGFEAGYLQGRGSASAAYTPPFRLE